ncbi:MAG: hypothetical protein IIC67_05210 [Thaumarchaeota archaeon]|nr:hypothetical protein [Nitrososphaerota archaeon]
MKRKIILFFLIGIISFGSFVYVWAQDMILSIPTECFEMWKIPKVEKLENEQYMASCVDINPFVK